MAQPLESRMHLSAIRFGQYPTAPIHQWNLIRLGEYERSAGKLTRTAALYFQPRASRQVLPLPERFTAKHAHGLDPRVGPARLKKTRHIKNLEPPFRFLWIENALGEQVGLRVQ